MRDDPQDPARDDAWSDDDVRVADVLRSMTPADDEREDLPPGLWERISGQLETADQSTGVAGATRLRVVEVAERDTTDRDTPDQDGPTSTMSDHEARDHVASGDAPSTGARSNGVIDLDDRRRQRWFRLAAAAAAVVIAAGTFGVINANGSGPSQELVASVDLEPLKDSGNGRAELIDVDGVEKLRLTAAGLEDAPQGYHHEIWLIDAEVTDPRSLGELPPGQTEIVVDLPAGVDPDDFPIVDVNVQVDGQEQHSGVDTSVLRGSLA